MIGLSRAAGAARASGPVLTLDAVTERTTGRASDRPALSVACVTMDDEAAQDEAARNEAEHKAAALHHVG